MSKGNRIELIGIDDGANQAIDLACCKKFSSIKKSSIVKLNRDVDIESLVVVVATRIDSYIVENLISHIKEEQKPILIVPKTLERAYELEILYIKNFRIILSSIDNLVSLSLSNTILLLEFLLFADEVESQISPDLNDIYKVLAPKSVNSFRQSSGSDLVKATLNFINVFSKKDEIESIYLIYEVNENDEDIISSVPVSLDIIESKFLPTYSPIFIIKSSSTLKGVKIAGLISKKYSFLSSVQESIEKESRYIPKISILIDAYRDDKIDDEEIELLGVKNNISPEDIIFFHQLIYELPDNLLKLLRTLRDDGIESEIKVDMVVSALVNGGMDENILMELIEIFEIPINVVMERFKLREEGKLSIREMDIDKYIKLRYPKIFFGINELNPILVLINEIVVESNGILSIDVDSVYEYLPNSDSPFWYVSKQIDKATVREIVNLLKPNIS
jgi:hypothetical protein